MAKLRGTSRAKLRGTGGAEPQAAEARKSERSMQNVKRLQGDTSGGVDGVDSPTPADQNTPPLRASVLDAMRVASNWGVAKR